MGSRDHKIEIVLWSIALPGFGQLLNGKFLKGLLLISLEFLVNVQSRLNTIIILSFNMNIVEAIRQADFQWLMFYPCLYLFAIWDAYRDAGGGKSRYATLPLVFGAFAGTVGIIYSHSFGKIFGPVWLGISGALLGFVCGTLIRLLLKRTHS
jgi:hypothetical protein